MKAAFKITFKATSRKQMQPRAKNIIIERFGLSDIAMQMYECKTWVYLPAQIEFCSRFNQPKMTFGVRRFKEKMKAAVFQAVFANRHPQKLARSENNINQMKILISLHWIFSFILVMG